MFQKEGFSIFQVFDKLDYLFMCSNSVHVFTGHRNLLFVFVPSAFEPALGRHIVSKVQRWALFLSRFQYTIEQIDGSRNTFANMLTRWCKDYREQTLRTVCSLISKDEHIIPTNEEFNWPGIQAYRESQQKYCRTAAHPDENNDGILTKAGSIWMPEDDAETQLKALVVSHCVSMRN